MKRLMRCRRIPCLAVLLCAIALPCAAAPEPAPLDVDWVLSAVARPAPSRTPFVELRDSPMLRQPLRLQGEYRREADGSLVREVTAPYAETTTLAAGEALVERAGRAPRRIPLQQVPELAAIQAGFGALLAGDRELLQKTYSVQASGVREQWQLQLLPRDPRLAAALQRIELHGRGAELRCVESHPAKAPVQRTLMAGAAAAAAGIDDPAALAALCHGDGGPKR
jgi:hypothetical protein